MNCVSKVIRHALTWIGAFATLALILTPIVLIFVFLRANPIPSSRSDNSLLTQEPCRVPCWHNLVPGQSTLGEVRQVVSNDSFIPSHEIEEDVDGSRTIFYWWGRLNEIGYDHAGRFVVNNGVLSSIEITPNLDFTLEQILNIYGEPTATEAQFEVWRSPWILFVNLYLYYPSNGLVAEFKFRATEDYPASREAYSLYPEIPGRGFALYRPAESIEGFASSAYGLAGQELQSWLDSIVLGWPGYESAVMMHPDARSHWDSPLIITMTPDQNTER